MSNQSSTTNPHKHTPSPARHLHAAAVASSDGGISPPDPDGFEMAPIGHRRRGSLINSSSTPPKSGSGSSVLPPPPLTPPPPTDSDEWSNDSFGFGSDHNDIDDGSAQEHEIGLSAHDRSLRRQRQRRGRLAALHGRMAEKSPGLMGPGVTRRLTINAGLILLWYIFSLSISLYNKWMFDQNRLNFAFPLFTTSMHMLVQFSLASLVLYFIPFFRPYYKHTSDLGRSRHETEPTSKMSKLYYLTRIGPCGTATSLDIGLGNMSLKSITLTFYTMCKSSSLAFVLVFAFIFRLETPTLRLVAIIATMTLGVVLMVSGEIEFKLSGFLLVISAAFFSGFRWALTQLLLLRNPATSNPFSSIFFLSPVMFVTLFAMAIPVEGFAPLLEGLGRLGQEFGLLTPFFLLFPGCIAFLMIATEFALLQRTSVVTLSIAGIFKEVVTITAASLIFHDRLSIINVIGLLTTLVAIGAYNYVKISNMRAQEAQEEAEGLLEIE